MIILSDKAIKLGLHKNLNRGYFKIFNRLNGSWKKHIDSERRVTQIGLTPTGKVGVTITTRSNDGGRWTNVFTIPRKAWNKWCENHQHHLDGGNWQLPVTIYMTGDEPYAPPYCTMVCCLNTRHDGSKYSFYKSRNNANTAFSEVVKTEGEWNNFHSP